MIKLKTIITSFFNFCQLQSGENEDLKTTMMKHLFRTFKENSNADTVTGLSEQAEGLLTKAVEIWPVLSKPFQKDQMEEVIATEGKGIKMIRDVLPRTVR